MRISGIILSLLVVLAILPSVGNAMAAPSISIETSQSVYEYGDFLSIIVNVSEITGDNAIVHVIDPTERKVMLLNRPITITTTAFPSQHPFDSAIWKPGTYMLELEYSNQISSTQFTIDDSGKVILPAWIRDVAKLWVTDQISAPEFSVAIEYMINVEIIKIPYTEVDGEISATTIPEWIKNNAGWWAVGAINDTEFTLALQYLVKTGIITVNLDKI